MPARLAPYAALIAGGAALACLPLLGPTNSLLSFATSTIIFAIAGSGLGFLWGQSGQLTMAHAAVFGIGAYTAAIMSKVFGLGLAAALPFSIVVGLAAGALVALPSLRVQGHYFVVLTFAVAEVILVIMRRATGLTGGQDGIMTLPGKQTVLGLRVSDRADYYVLAIIFAVAVLAVLLFIMRSRWGTTLRGIRENPELAASLGVSVVKNRIYAFAISGGVAAVAGLLYTYQVRFIDPEQFNVHISIIFLMVVLVGGKAHLLGPALGSAFYFFVAEYIGLPPVYNLIGFGVLLIIMILTAPDGILSLIDRLLDRFGARGAAIRAQRAAKAAADGTGGPP